MTGGPSLVVAAAEDTSLRWVGTPRVAGPEWMKYPIITAGMLGLQAVWTIEMSQASPYLLELGLSKSYMSLVFVAGPLSGLIMQPLIGAISDRCQSRFGRRRPFIWGGCAVTVLGMFLMSFSKEIATLFFSNESSQTTLAITLAVFAVFLIDFSINAVQSSDRALLVDTLPPSEQEEGNAWAGRLSGFGSVAGFWIGNIDLPSIFPFMGKTQLQALTVFTTLVLLSTHAVTTYATEERVLLDDPRPKVSFWGTAVSIYTNAKTLPRDIRSICFCQFFAWIGWFPILFFTSTWVSELYTNAAIANGRSSKDNALWEEGTRAGSRALFFFAVTSLVTAILLPLMVASTTAPPESGSDGVMARLVTLCDQIGLPSAMRPPYSWLSLAFVWALSHALFALSMGLTFFVTTVRGADFVIGLTGVCWAVTQWAPFSLLGELILADSKESTDGVPLRPLRSSLSQADDVDFGGAEGSSLLPHDTRTSHEEQQSLSRSPTDVVFVRHSFDSGDDGCKPISSLEEEEGLSPSETSGRRTRSFDRLERRANGRQSTAEQAGVILGIHNVFVVIPQFLVTFLSSIIFYLLAPARPSIPAIPGIIPTTNTTLSSPPPPPPIADGDEILRQNGARAEVSASPDAVGFVFRFGGVSAVVACFLCWKLMRSLDQVRRSF